MKGSFFALYHENMVRFLEVNPCNAEMPHHFLDYSPEEVFTLKLIQNQPPANLSK